MSIDLHLHSLVSDGVASPDEVVRRAAAVGLQTIAIADHDDVEGVAAGLAAAKEVGITLVPAIELTARVSADHTVHLLGYGIDPSAEPLTLVARKNRLGKRAQAAAILALLRANGIELTDAEVGLDRESEAYVGRNRIASALVTRGIVKNRLKAFKRWLNPGTRAYAPPVVVEAADAIQAIRSARGVAVLAHPTEDDLSKHLGKLCDLGVEGIEAFRPKAVGSLLERVTKAAERRGLLVTGGSDWHGHYPGIPLGDWKVRAEQVRPFLERLGLPV